ncbi:MAG TPA: MarR family transcriptional regulator [Flavobacteriales bacterium]|jgi:DNA-binding MarR family transcriptional regulator|nr:MarR family transcriptional regulator [Flavobacteriales bacterium]
MYARIVYIVCVRPEDTIDFHVRFAWAGIARQYGQLAAARGTTMAMGQTLLNIEKNGTPSTQLGPRMGMEKTSLSRLLNNLEGHGMIERKADEADRRIVRIHLTAAGKKERDRARTAVRTFNAWIAEQLGTDRTERLLGDLQKLNDLIVQYPTRDALPELDQNDNPDSNAA